MKLWSLVVVVIVAMTLLVAACGDNGDDNGTNGVDEPTATAPADDDGDAEATATTPADDGDATGAGALADLDGSWGGVWNNDTFGSSAEVTIDITVNDDGTASFALDLLASDTGSPFGIPAPGPRTLDGSHDGETLTVDVTGDDLFGDMTVLIADGVIAGNATMDPVAGIAGLSFEGTVTGDTMDLTYTVTFPDGTDATGTASLTKS